MKVHAALLAMSLAMPMSSYAQTVAPNSRAISAAKALQNLDAQQRVARQRLRVAREQDRLEAEEAKVPDANEPPLAPLPATPDPAQSPPSATKIAVAEAERVASAQKELAKLKADEDFGKFGFGAGLSLTIDLGSKDRIAEAQIVNGIVRVTDQNNAIARLLLETHFLFKPEGNGPFGIAHNMWGIGPFVAVQPGEERIIEAVGLGLMIAFRREETKTDSFNIGVGLMMDPNTRVLGDGFVANAAPPNGEEEVRYRETAQKGLILMTSFSF